MRVSVYIANKLSEFGVRHVFMLSARIHKSNVALNVTRGPGGIGAESLLVEYHR
jgi:hypothetical protein